MSAWEFDIQKGGSRRSDGLWFEVRLPDTDMTPPADYVWVVHFPGPPRPPVWVNPVKRDCHTPKAVEAYCDEHFPAGVV